MPRTALVNRQLGKPGSKPTTIPVRRWAKGACRGAAGVLAGGWRGGEGAGKGCGYRQKVEKQKDPAYNVNAGMFRKKATLAFLLI